MVNAKRNATERPPQVSSRLSISEANLYDSSTTENPWQRLAKMAETVTHDLMSRVGYDRKITVTIEPLPEHHPDFPGMQVYARTRL